MALLAPQGPDAAVQMRALSLAAIAENPDNFVCSYASEAALPLQHFVDEIEKGWLFLAPKGQGMIVLRPSGWVHTAYVCPEARGQGLGDLLVRSVISTAQTQGLARLELGVFEENRYAVALYARHGFSVTTRTPFEGGRTDCVMARAL